MVRVVMQPAVVGVVHEVGVSGLNTEPDCDGGVGIGFGSNRTWKYEPALVLSTNATLVPSIESAGDVLICPPGLRNRVVGECHPGRSAVAGRTGSRVQVIDPHQVSLRP